MAIQKLCNANFGHFQPPPSLCNEMLVRMSEIHYNPLEKRHFTFQICPPTHTHVLHNDPWTYPPPDSWSYRPQMQTSVYRGIMLETPKVIVTHITHIEKITRKKTKAGK